MGWGWRVPGLVSDAGVDNTVPYLSRPFFTVRRFQEFMVFVSGVQRCEYGMSSSAYCSTTHHWLGWARSDAQQRKPNATGPGQGGRVFKKTVVVDSVSAQAPLPMELPAATYFLQFHLNGQEQVGVWNLGKDQDHLLSHLVHFSPCVICIFHFSIESALH